MPQTTVYSFSNVHLVINPPGFQSYTVNGQGVGEIAITWAQDNTVHDLAADGSVMVSKIQADNASISITVQQTSPLHQYLKGVFNALMAAGSEFWASTNIALSSPNGGFDAITLTGVSIQKRSDQPFQQQGQRVTWNFMAANAQTTGSVSAAVNAIANVGARILT